MIAEKEPERSVCATDAYVFIRKNDYGKVTAKDIPYSICAACGCEIDE